jgi:hypothetical protein
MERNAELDCEILSNFASGGIVDRILTALPRLWQISIVDIWNLDKLMDELLLIFKCIPNMDKISSLNYV